MLSITTLFLTSFIMSYTRSKNGDCAMNGKKTHSVFCPHCGWRMFDKSYTAIGVIEIKCCKCRKIVEVNLSENIGQANNRN